MYSRNYQGRGNRFSDRKSGPERDGSRFFEQAEARPVPPPSYGGTLYISARKAEPDSDKRAEPRPLDSMRASESPRSSETGVRTVRYSGEPYSPGQTGAFRDDRGSSSSDDLYGKGGHPDLGGGDSLRIRRSRRGPIVGDRSDIDYTPSLQASSTPSFFSLPSGLPSPEDIILIALIITLIGAKSSGDFDDDLLLIILAVLLFSGSREN